MSGVTSGGWPEPITGIPSGVRQPGLWPEPITGITETSPLLPANGAGPLASAEELFPSQETPQMEEPAKVREIGLQRGEEVTHIFCPSDGLAAELPAAGEVLVLTNERIIAFCQSDSRRETYLVPTSEMKHAVVKAGSRNPATLFQGILMVFAGLMAYVIIGYWLASRLDGPTVPVLNMDLGPLIALVIMFAGLGLIAEVYFTKPNGTVTFQAEGLQFSFPFRGEAAVAQVYDVVNAAFASRRQGVSATRPEGDGRIESTAELVPPEAEGDSPSALAMPVEAEPFDGEGEAREVPSA